MVPTTTDNQHLTTEESNRPFHNEVDMYERYSRNKELIQDYFVNKVGPVLQKIGTAKNICLSKLILSSMA